MVVGLIAKVFTKKILGETAQNKFGTEDPYFDYVPATRLDGKPTGKVKKRKKALPPGISEKDGKVLTKVKRRAYRLDLALFSCCGIRFGWGSAIGLVPAIGDVLDLLMALIVMKTCMQIDGGLPTGLKMKMLSNIAFDFVIGLVPFVGDVVDAMFRANTRNAALLEAHLREVGKKSLRNAGRPMPAVDPSDPDEFDRIHGEDAPAYTSQPPSRNPSMTNRPQRSRSHSAQRSRSHSAQRSRSHSPRRDRRPVEPEPARVRESRGWFGRSRPQPEDIETGDARADARRERKSRRMESRDRR